MLLRRMGRGDIVAHGFRSTFRDWAAETTNFQGEVVEMALAHAIGNAVEAAYRRGDLIEETRAHGSLGQVPRRNKHRCDNHEGKGGAAMKAHSLQFITDETGQRVAVVLPLGDYERLLAILRHEARRQSEALQNDPQEREDAEFIERMAAWD